MGIFQNNLMGAAAAAAAGGGADFYTYQIPYSARFDGSTSNLSRTWGAPSETKKAAISIWLKRTKFATQQSIFTASGPSGSGSWNSGSTFVEGADKIGYYGDGGGNNATGIPQFRDPSAWYHLVVIMDTSQASAVDRWKIYVNGFYYPTGTTYWSADAPPALNGLSGIGGNGGTNYIGSYTTGTSNNFWGYMADCVGIDGTAAISDFGETKNGVWIAKDPSELTFGNNGWWLDFAASGDMGNDVSGNNNDWTAGGITASDQMLDSPTFNSTANGGNFCTAMPSLAANVLSEGNLKIVGDGGNFDNTYSSFQVDVEDSEGWYWEWRVLGADASTVYGIAKPEINTNMNKANPTAGFYGIANAGVGVSGDGNKRDSATNASYGVSSQSAGDVLSFAIKGGAIWVGLNGTWMNSATAGEIEAGTTTNAAFTGLTGYYSPSFGINGSQSGTANFGQDSTFAGTETLATNADANGYGNFHHAVPDTLKALCSANLSTAAAVDPAQTDANYPQKLFVPKLYTGDGASTLTISGMDFQPDFTWIKNRDAADGHCWFDSTRGVTKLLASNSTAAATTDADTLKSWTSDGFTVGADVKVNTSTEKYVGWNLRANGGTTASNGNGSITSTVQVDPSSGFSIITYTGTGSAATIGHGLGVKPSCIIVKDRGAINDWAVYHGSVSSDPETDYLLLNNTNALTDDSTYWNDTAPTTSVFSIGTNADVNTNTNTYVAYCFANIEGYIKAGSYIGNANADGTFVYTGFRPSFFISKPLTATPWRIQDDKRNPYNVGDAVLYPYLVNAEATAASNYIDLVSNGVKMRATGGFNAALTFIYIAFAENPFQYATAR